MCAALCECDRRERGRVRERERERERGGSDLKAILEFLFRGCEGRLSDKSTRAEEEQ